MSTAVQQGHRAQVLAALNEVVDPCSAAASMPLGMVDMGLVEEVSIGGDGVVDVAICTTAPLCHFVGHFNIEVERRVQALDWVEEVNVSVRYETIWDSSRMAGEARARVQARRGRPLWE